jgi:hypothetical protein
MVLHPALHLEIARQRHQDLLAEAERQRTAKAVDHARVTAAAARRLRRRAGASPSASTPRTVPHSDVEVGLEV